MPAAISRALDWPEGYLTDVLVADHRSEPVAPPSEDDSVLEALHRIENRLIEISNRLDMIESGGRKVR